MTEVFLRNYCNSSFWESNFTSLPYPQFTNCFQNTVLIWVPVAVFIIFSPFYFYFYKQSNQENLKWSKFHICKFLFTLLLFSSTLAQLFYRVFQFSENGKDYLVSSFVTPATLAATIFVAIILQEYQHIKGDITNGLLLLFYLLLLLCGVVTLTDQIRKTIDNDGEPEEMFEFIIFLIYFALLFIVVILQTFAEPKARDQNQSPEMTSSSLNRLFFWWFNPIILLGYKKPLTTDDVWDLEKRDKAKILGEDFQKIWAEELKKSRDSMNESKKGRSNEAFDEIQSEETKNSERFDYKNAIYKASVWKAMFKKFWKMMSVAILFKLLNDTIQFLKPTLLSAMIDFTLSPETPVYQGYVIAVAMYVVTVLQAVCLQQYFHRCYIIGMQIRTSLVSVIYDKALKISNSAKQESTLGEIVNLMSTDAQRLMDLTTYVNILWSGPYQIILAVVFLWAQLQEAVLAGLAVMILVMPINAILIKKMRSLSTLNMKLKDERIKLMNEVLNGIKVLKLYGWEPSFEQQIKNIREKELACLRKIAILKAVNSFLWNCTPFLVTVVSFSVYLGISPTNILDSQTTFVSISLFEIIRFPLVMLPNVFTALVQAQVSITRITNFLLGSEIDPDAVDRKYSGEEQIKVENASFSWEEKGDCVLHDLDFSIKPGELVAVVGHVGCGKSSLISSLLGEMEKKKGYIGLKGSVAYVPQQAWIQNATLKSNILFGKTLQTRVQMTSFSTKHAPSSHVDEKFYEQTISATALQSDLDILSAGDQTEIGEKGINLSGGQKQRVSLARAIFQDADVYLLDDPLSAVDAHIGKHIFEKVIGPEGLLRNKTRVLVTHGVQYLPLTDRIIVLDDGKIREIGSYQELVARGGEFSKFLDEFASNQKDPFEDTEDVDVDEDHLSSLPQSLDLIEEFDERSEVTSDHVIRKEHRESIRSRHSRTSTLSRMSSKKVKMELKKMELESKNLKGKLTEKEKSEEGSVKLSVFLKYFKAVGASMCVFILSTEALYQAAVIGGSMWLSDWSEVADSQTVSEFRSEIGLRLGVYGALGAAQGLFIMLDVYTLAIGCLSAARKLHENLLHSILRAPSSFFDTTPLGRIVNRFSKDVYTVDDTLPWALRQWNGCMFGVIAIIVVIMYSTPIFGAVIVPIAFLYFIAQRFYVRTSRQLKRIENVTRSPIYSHFSETLSGVSLIRAFDHQQRFVETSNGRIDFNQKCYHSNVVSNRWLAIRLDVIGNAIVFFAALFAVIERDSVNGALAGLSLTYALNITSTLNWWVRQTSETEIHVVSVERLKEYADVESEAPWDIPEERPPNDWPSKGNVQFRGYSTRYRPGLDLVVKNVSFNIEAGQKVGIVGRTGAGKSSLTLALFRIIEAAHGDVIIDDVDVSKIGLHDLRSKLTIIPQDPVLFSGTLRMNLDPFEVHSDEDLWTSLEHSHLKDFVSSLPLKLDHICSEGGENLSVGQRQLVCLARALLRQSKILVLDEATAAVDLQTDDLIQTTIRHRFHDSTVITIAHRLNTIIDYDRIVVLSEGKIKELEDPKILLQNPDSMFYSMAEDAGLV